MGPFENEDGGRYRSRLTAAFLAEYRVMAKREIDAANLRAYALCVHGLNANGIRRTRRNNDFRNGLPYGSMSATASPNGEVSVEGRVEARIRDPPTGAAGPRADRSEKKRGGHTSGSHTASGHHDNTGSSSSAGRRTTPSASSNTTKKKASGGSSSGGGGHSKPTSRHQ